MTERMTTPSLPALLERIRNATDADRELLLDAARALLQDDRAPYTWWARFKQLVDAGAFLDAAHALRARVKPGWTYSVDATAPLLGISVRLYAPTPLGGCATGDHKSECLALLAALVAAEMEGEDG